MPEIGAQGGDHPHRAGSRQAGEKFDKQSPVVGTDARNREQFLQLIDDEHQLGVLEGEQTARLTPRFGQTAERVGEQIARIADRGPQMRREPLQRPAPERSARADRRPVPTARVSAFCQAEEDVGALALGRNTARRRNAAPLMRCGFISLGTTPAFTSDDLPEPLAPDTNRKARPARALAASCSIAFVTAASRPKKIGACSNS